MFYQYCGPGTKLNKRLARGDKGINPLDTACREHNIAYERSNSIVDRNEANHILEQRAWERFKSKDSGLKEKSVAWAVARKKFKSTKTKVPRIVNIPKKGGVLPFIPIFAGLSALGALTGGVANISLVCQHEAKGCENSPFQGTAMTIMLST
ncbi:Uncharacterized protein FWK35_00018991 [Aphis craccivora]|uniref:Phospholipase A2-like domain-containing protein n=1 Tax=Aphis craccivora TaxID=307492 RepID=A0A6G0XQN9_APHCR|nr:Uncharacterized protein FWK35_00018991 [Aphis craccivora]